jgi:hypothetical protein
MGEDPYRRVAGFYDRLFEPMNHGFGADPHHSGLGSSAMPVRAGRAAELAINDRGHHR